MGYVNSPVDDAENAPDQYSGYYYAVWGAFRFSFVDYLFESPPKYRFHVRDILDIQGGVGYGSAFYTNLYGSVGLKFKYDFSEDFDFGMNIGFRAGQDHIAFYGFYGQPFMRYKAFFGQVGFGSNVNDKTDLGNQRKFTTVNVKYFLQPESPKSNYVTFALNFYSGRNDNPNHEWERNSQVMVGVGRQLGN